MGVLDIAVAHARRQVALARRAALEVARLWARVDRQAVAASWSAGVPAAIQVLGSAQAIAAASAGVYLDDLLDEYGLPGDSEGRIVVESFAGVASDGRDLAGLLYQPAIASLTALKGGATEARAMASGRFVLDMIVRSQVADAGRVADGVALAVRPQLAGYVRMVVGGTCDRCLILAGRFYRWNQGFQRHPRCDCRHIPASEDVAGDLTTDPKAAFEAMPAEEQERVFGKAGAQAIRDGADISQVVNARRGARGLAPAGARVTDEEARALRGGRSRGRLEAVDVYGRQVYITTEGVTTRGLAGKRLGARETGTKRGRDRYRSATAPRLMPESIYALADGDRDEAIRLLRRFGYIT